MGEVRGSVAALVEVFLKEALRLEGESEVHVGERVRFYISEYERIFRDAQQEERDKDLAAKVCRALCRRRVIKEMAQRDHDDLHRGWRQLSLLASHPQKFPKVFLARRTRNAIRPILLHPGRKQFQCDAINQLRVEGVTLLRGQIAQAALNRLFPVGIHLPW